MNFLKHIIEGLGSCLKIITKRETNCSGYQRFVSVTFLLLIISLIFIFNCFFQEFMNIYWLPAIFLSILATFFFLSLLIGFFTIIELINKKNKRI